MIPRVSDSELGGGGVAHLHIATGPFNCLAFGHHRGVSDVPGPDRRLPQCSLGPGRGEGFLSQRRWPLGFHELGFFGECAAALTSAGGGASPFGCVCANLQRKHVAHVIRDTARPRMRTCGRRRGACTQTYDNSCQLLSDPQPSPSGRGHSASSVTPPPNHSGTLTHARLFICLAPSLSGTGVF